MSSQNKQTLKRTVKYFLIRSFIPNFVKMIILEPKNWFLEFSNLHSGKVEKNNDLKHSNYLPLCKKSEKTNDPFLRKMPHWQIDKQTDRQADRQTESVPVRKIY